MGRWNAALLAVVLGGAVVLGPAAMAEAHETDQLSVPVGQELADLGPELNALFVRTLDESVERLNRDIERALSGETPRHAGPARRQGRATAASRVRRADPAAVLADRYSPEGVARETWQRFGPAVQLIGRIDKQIHSRAMKKKYPGKLTAYRASKDSIYTGLFFPLDPRATVLSPWRVSTMNAYGVYMGPDKVGHFTDMGYHYYKRYAKAIREGKTPEQAMAHATELGTQGAISEKGVLGTLTAGAYSNGDLAANYVGCLFYRNLTEPVTLKGKLRPAILERDGDYWKLADFVHGDPKFVERFISDHYNEALNPSLFQAISRSTVRKKVEANREDLLQWYKPRYQGQDPNRYFEKLVRELSTYHGEPYGHSGQFDEIVGLWNTGPIASIEQ